MYIHDTYTIYGKSRLTVVGLHATERERERERERETGCGYIGDFVATQR